jgi:hypothetical protein
MGTSFHEALLYHKKVKLLNGTLLPNSSAEEEETVSGTV